ncbi:MAG: polysaccharide deacetylase family protein [Micrococcales bacterium]|nr:polysaccharide deacetylase family protein [Micrococcales bacterium]
MTHVITAPRPLVDDCPPAVAPTPPGGRRGWRWAARLAAGLMLFTGGLAVGGQAASPQTTRLSPTDRTFPAPVGVSTGVSLDIVWRVQADPSDRLLALTFDDGPDPDGTVQVLQVLAAHHATATFFELGESVETHPQVVRQVLDGGHEVGLHGWSHSTLILDDGPTIESDLDRAEAALRAVGAEPRLFRPTYGRIDSPGLGAAATRGYTIALWSDRLDDHSDTHRLAQRLQPGAIVMCHDGRGHVTPELLDRIDDLLTELDQAGYRYVTVSELLASPDPP